MEKFRGEEMSTAYIGIGSNLGDRQKNCERAIELLLQQGISVNKRSSFYETEPWGMKDQPLFLNMAVEVETGCSPEELLAVVKGIESAMGRDETVRWGPRVIDLDILLIDQMVVSSRDLEVPHPHMHVRAFVLEPLEEIAPHVIHPLLKKSVRELRDELDKTASGQVWNR
ncbi:MAG: 2-amino-4-hydroxy-6-hydroxymethyldihydropteridine diphosphokinase [Nitrospirota bacterium]